MSELASEPTSTARRVLARLATEVLAPWVWVCALPIAIAWHATQALLPTVLWGALIALTGSLIPMAIIVRGARGGRWDGHHVTNREGRWVPLLACIASLATGWVLLLVFGAPRELIALTAAMLGTLMISLAITFGARFKISIHAAVSAGAVVMLAIAYGPWLLLAGLLAVLVAWSRVELADHTTAQVLSGAALGVIAGGLVYFGVMALP
ncbi:hypothetical protein GCM10010174_36730 [Kutzneria viridogrisea]|uniref:Phosphatidic acid phosphatase type 2/haloperoxidase domain-containing protein n=2 Tax=Kutzneria TaxID=43356 RepID=W5W0S7_9PSEU|nr:hypothetical protein [Kutzneria albida]AHH94773.1 hypothetical protein KALB_1400 [Kutzneria albida DSM 43870]MBA8930442.1 hypothetical protein [Kutzneria viridogrisea]